MPATPWSSTSTSSGATLQDSTLARTPAASRCTRLSTSMTKSSRNRRTPSLRGVSASSWDATRKRAIDQRVVARSSTCSARTGTPRRSASPLASTMLPARQRRQRAGIVAMCVNESDAKRRVDFRRRRVDFRGNRYLPPPWMIPCDANVCSPPKGSGATTATDSPRLCARHASQNAATPPPTKATSTVAVRAVTQTGSIPLARR